MKILITGGSGLIGTAIINDSRFADHAFIVLTRDPASASKKLGSRASCIAGLEEISPATMVDAVINLAGEPIVGKRWSDKQKQKLRRSRIALTQSLVHWMSQRKTPPNVMISGSAIGYYGNTGDAELNESSPAGSDFAATLCADWEKEANNAAAFGTRVCTIRTGLVLSSYGGMLEKMVLPFRLGLGSQIGDGSQWMSWIHIDDQVDIIHNLLQHNEHKGAFNLTAPNPATNRQFSDTLASGLGRPRLIRTPAMVMRLALGEAADLLLGGQKVLPDRLVRHGYRFHYSELKDAIASVI